MRERKRLLGESLGGNLLELHIVQLLVETAGREQFIVPVGGKVEMDADAGTFRLLAPVLAEA